MNVKWWRAAGIRAVKTICQAAIAMIGTSVVLSEVDWKVTVSAALLAGVLSLLTSVAGLPEIDMAAAPVDDWPDLDNDPDPDLDDDPGDE